MRIWLALAPLALAAFTSAGCNAHVHLPAPPPPGATDGEIDAYGAEVGAVGARKQAVVISEVNLSTGLEKSHTQRAEYLELSGGQRVYAVEDLLPVVGAASECGKAATEAAHARDMNAIWGVAGGGLAAGALGVLLVQSQLPVDAHDSGPSASQYAALGMGAASLVSFGVYIFTFGDVTTARDAAFACYPDALAGVLVDLRHHAPRAAAATPPATTTTAPPDPDDTDAHKVPEE